MVQFGRIIRNELTMFPPDYMQHLVFYLSMRDMLRHGLDEGKSIRTLIAMKSNEIGDDRLSPPPSNSDEELLSARNLLEGVDEDDDDDEDDARDTYAHSTESQKDPVMCYICQEYITNEGDSVMLTSCSHEFHTYCLRGWVGHDNDTCPNCRTKMRDLLDKDSDLQLALSDGRLFHGRFWKLLFTHIKKVDNLFVGELKTLRIDLQKYIEKAIKWMELSKKSQGFLQTVPTLFKKITLLRSIRKLYMRMLLLRDFCNLDNLAIKNILKKRDKQVGMYTMRVVRKYQRQMFRYKAMDRNTGALANLELLARGLYNIVAAFSKNNDPDGDILRLQSWKRITETLATAPMHGVDQSMRTLVYSPADVLRAPDDGSLTALREAQREMVIMEETELEESAQQQETELEESAQQQETELEESAQQQGTELEENDQQKSPESADRKSEGSTSAENPVTAPVESSEQSEKRDSSEQETGSTDSEAEKRISSTQFDENNSGNPADENSSGTREAPDEEAHSETEFDLGPGHRLATRTSMSLSFSESMSVKDSVKGIPESLGKKKVLLREYKQKISKRPGQKVLATHFLRDEVKRAGKTRRNTTFEIRGPPRRPTLMFRG